MSTLFERNMQFEAYRDYSTAWGKEFYFPMLEELAKELNESLFVPGQDWQINTDEYPEVVELKTDDYRIWVFPVYEWSDHKQDYIATELNLAWDVGPNHQYRVSNSFRPQFEETYPIWEDDTFDPQKAVQQLMEFYQSQIVKVVNRVRAEAEEWKNSNVRMDMGI